MLEGCGGGTEPEIHSLSSSLGTPGEAHRPPGQMLTAAPGWGWLSRHPQNPNPLLWQRSQRTKDRPCLRPAADSGRGQEDLAVKLRPHRTLARHWRGSPHQHRGHGAPLSACLRTSAPGHLSTLRSLPGQHVKDRCFQASAVRHRQLLT